MVKGVMVRRKDEEIGPLSPEELRAQFAQGAIHAQDLAWAEEFGDWMAVADVLQGFEWLAWFSGKREKRAEPPQAGGVTGVVPSRPTTAQLARLRVMGVSVDTARTTRDMAQSLIAQAEERQPAGRGMLLKLSQHGLPCEPGISIGEAKRRLRPVLHGRHLGILAQRGIPHTGDIAFEDAEELAEAGLPSEQQIAEARGFGFEFPPNTGARTAATLLYEAAQAEERLVGKYAALAASRASMAGLDRKQVRNVVQYLNQHFSGWEDDQPERRFFDAVQKFYPHVMAAGERRTGCGPQSQA